VLLNYYRGNQDSMGMHSDDERELGNRPIIASLSLGEERVFILKHKTSSPYTFFLLNSDMELYRNSHIFV